MSLVLCQEILVIKMQDIKQIVIICTQFLVIIIVIKLLLVTAAIFHHSTKQNRTDALTL